MKTHLLRLLAGFLLSALAAGAADKDQLHAHLRRYNEAGKAVIGLVIAKTIDEAEIEKHVSVMVGDAQWFMSEYARAFPKGETLLKTVSARVDDMRKLSFDELEKDWHDLGYFEKHPEQAGLDLKEEENEHFTDPIHTLVHPLLVLKAAQLYAKDKKDDALKSMKEEAEEGLEQVERMTAALLDR